MYLFIDANSTQSLHRKIKEIVAQAKLIENDNQLLVSAVPEREKLMA